MRILVLIPGGIDNQILFFPTLASLRSQYPSATIDVIVEPRAKDAYQICPHVDQIIGFDYRDRNGLADYLNLLGIIREKQYEVALSLTQRWSIDFVLWLDGIPTRIGYQTGPTWFLTQAIAWQDKQYISDSYHDLTRCVGVLGSRPPLTINIPTAARDWAQSQRNQLELSSNYVLLHDLPTETVAESTYPVPQWRGVIEDIQRQFPDWSVVLLRSAANAAWITQMQTTCPNAKILSIGDIGKLAAIIEGANYLICSNSAPMHLAVAANTKTVALFGPGKAHQSLPSNDPRFCGLESPTGKIADIMPSTIFQQLAHD